MAVITNDDLDTMIEVEDLLHKKLVATNGIKDTYKRKEYYYFDENDKEYEVWVKYWNMVEKFINNKAETNKRSAMFNKKNAEYHRLSNNLYSARKKNDTKRIEYYTKKLEEYKNRKGER